jgi:hypothetical protein
MHMSYQADLVYKRLYNGKSLIQPCLTSCIAIINEFSLLVVHPDSGPLASSSLASRTRDGNNLGSHEPMLMNRIHLHQWAEFTLNLLCELDTRTRVSVY